MEEFLTNFLANLSSGIILAILGYCVVKYNKDAIVKFIQNNSSGIQNAGGDIHNTIVNNPKPDSSSKEQNINELTKK